MIARGRSWDSASSVETRRTRSKADTDPKAKAVKPSNRGKGGNEVSERGLRARARGLNKAKESESSDESTSEADDKVINLSSVTY